MNPRPVPVLTSLLLVVALAACGGGGGGGSTDGGSDGPALIDVSVGGVDGVALNQRILLEFDLVVDPASVSSQTIRVRRAPEGALQVPGDLMVDGNLVTFYPRLPGAADLSDAGLQPGTTYEVVVPGGTTPNTVRDLGGDAPRETYRTTFSTASAGSPGLFVDLDPGSPPHVTSTNPEPDASGVARPDRISITLSEPLLPSTVTAGNVRLTMVERPAGTPLVPERPIEADLTLEQSRTSVVLRIAPRYPLADEAVYRLEVDRRVSDLAGNDLTPWTSRFTIRDEAPTEGALELGFDAGSEARRDDDATTASWNDDAPDLLSAVFTGGGGDGTDGDYRPTANDTLDTNAQPDGTFDFRSFEIPAGVTVRVVGDRPALIRSLKELRIDGVLDVSGFAGANSEATSTTTGVPSTPGGTGGPGGGRGGDVATNVPTSRTTSYKGNRGQDGADGWNAPGTGGEAASWGSVYNYKSGAGGAGGGHRTAGQDGAPSTNSSSVRRGVPGDGGGIAGNGFLSPLTGGGGGGAGMNGWYYSTPRSHGAGAGGGGGGALLISSARDVIVTGQVLGLGGDGGSVLVPTNSYSSAGGGGGAGGAILIRSSRGVVLEGATVSTAGGNGGGGGARYGGNGGDGSDGRIRLEDADGLVEAASATLVPPLPETGTFVPSGGAPSVARTVWMDTGVFDPVFSAVAPEDVLSSIPHPGQSIEIAVQMARESLTEPGAPDEDTASAWTDLATIESLNGHGYRFVRLRVTFTLPPDQLPDDPLPSISRIRLPFSF